MLSGGEGMNKTEMSFMDKISYYIGEKLAPVLMKIFNRPTLNVIKNSMVNVMPFILFGSIMLLVSLLGTNSMGTKEPIIKFLFPYTDKIALINSLSMGFMTLYFSVAVGINYAEEYKLDRTSCSLLSLMAFLIINIDKFDEGMISTASFGAQGLFPTMITSIFALKVYKVCIQRKIVIRMPEGVPPAVGAAFSSIIPYGMVGIFYWFVRTMMGINVLEVMQNMMQPVFSGADNIFVFTGYATINKLLWGLGIHADSLFGGILDPLKLTWIAANGDAAQIGAAIPHIWSTAVERTCLWTGPVLGLLVVLLFSRVKHLKAFSIASLPAAFFSIIEPVVFGLPVVMNPLLFVPFILSGFIGAIVTYGACMLSLVAIPFLELPWATPPLLIGFISSGDWKFIILTVINIVIGALIYYPFVKAFEKQEMMRIEQENSRG